MAKIPLSMSGDNLYSFKCSATKRHCNYAVCQHTVWAYKQSRLRGFEDCRDAIDKRTCPAIKMMLEERKAGKSLYLESYSALLVEREKRQALREEAEKAAKRRPSKAVFTSRSSVDAEEIKRRDQEIEAKIRSEHEDDVQSRIKKSRATKTPEPLMEGDNIFAAVVNAIAAGES